MIRAGHPMPTRRAICFAILLAATAWTVARPIAQDARVEIYGRVSDPETPPREEFTPGMTILLDGRRLAAPLTAVTDRTGYRFPDLPAGTYSLRLKHTNISPVTRENVVVTAGGRVEVNFDLHLEP